MERMWIFSLEIHVKFTWNICLWKESSCEFHMHAKFFGKFMWCSFHLKIDSWAAVYGAHLYGIRSWVTCTSYIRMHMTNKRGVQQFIRKLLYYCSENKWFFNHIKTIWAYLASMEDQTLCWRWARTKVIRYNLVGLWRSLLGTTLLCFTLWSLIFCEYLFLR